MQDPPKALRKHLKTTQDFARYSQRHRMRYGTDRRWVVADPENSEALIHYVWKGFAERIKELDEKLPGVWGYTERKIVLWVRPSKMLDQLRCIFWARVYESRALNIKIKKEEILVGFVTEKTWDAIISDDKNLAYLIRPIPRIEAAFEALMWRGLRHLLDWLDTPRDFNLMPANEQKTFLSTVFRVVQECERRLHPPNLKMAIERARLRGQLIRELEADGARLNVSEDRLDDFDLELLPDDDAFGEIGRNIRPELERGGIDGRGSDTGYDDDEFPEEGFSGGDSEEKDS